MQYLASTLGHHAVAGTTLLRKGGEYGNAILTRRPVLDVRRIDLTVYRREPRGAIDVDLDVDGRTVRVLVTHLGLLPGERRKQVRRLLDLLGDHRSDVVVLCGDINEWFAVGGPCAGCTRAWDGPPRSRRFLPHFRYSRSIASGFTRTRRWQR